MIAFCRITLGCLQLFDVPAKVFVFLYQGLGKLFNLGIAGFLSRHLAQFDDTLISEHQLGCEQLLKLLVGLL